VKKTAVTKAATAKTAGRKAGTNGTAAPAGTTTTAKKVPRKSAAVTPPVATVESGAESTT
jgi:hypothetical protein